MTRTRWLGALGLVGGLVAPAVAQDSGDPTAKVEAVRKQVQAATDAARAAVAEEQRVRDAATDTLAALGPEAVPALLKVVNDAESDPAADQDFAARCREALDRLGHVSDATKARAAELIAAIRDGAFDDGDVFEFLQFGGYAARELTKALDHAEFKDKPRPRARILGLLGTLGRSGRMDVVGELLKRCGAKFAGDCAGAATAMAEVAVVPTDDLTGEPDPKRLAARDAAVQAAGGVGPLLRVLTHHADPEARGAAAHALGALGRKDAVAALVTAAGDAAPSVREAALAALGAVTGAAPSGDASAWANWWRGAQPGYPAQAPTPDANSGS